MIPGYALNGALGLVLVVLLGLNWGLTPSPTLRNREFVPEMVRTVRYSAFAPNPNFADGKTLQQPVPGTVSRDALPLHYRGTPEDAARAGQELRNPIPAEDAAALQRGTFLFSNFCQPCHGQAGRGDGPVVLRGVPAPPPLDAEHAVRMKDGQLFHILTYGQGNMASYASQLSREDRWNVIVFVRSLQRHTARQTPGGDR